MNQDHVEEFFVQGQSVRTNNAQEAGPTGKLPGLWAQFYANHPKLTEPVYGVYSDYESDASGEFTVTAGTKVNASGNGSVSVKSGTYLEFPANGVMPAAIIDAWKTVWIHFSTPQKYVRAYKTDFEQYNGPESATIYIGIKESS